MIKYYDYNPSRRINKKPTGFSFKLRKPEISRTTRFWLRFTWHCFSPFLILLLLATVVVGGVYWSVNDTYMDNKQMFIDMAITLENAATASSDGMTEDEILQQQILKTLPIQEIVEIIKNSDNIADIFNSINTKRQEDPNFLSDEQFKELKELIEEYNNLYTD